MDTPTADDRPVEQALRELLAPLDRHLERGRSLLAAALVLAPAPFILLWLLSFIEAKHAAGWSVLAFVVLVLAGLGWELLMERLVRRRFERRFPADSSERDAALRILNEIETPTRIEEKLRDALSVSAQRVARHPPEYAPSEQPQPLLELPPEQPPPRSEAPPAAASSKPGGYYDYIPLEPLGGDEAPEKREGAR
jgi:hypothetical protein